MDFPIPKPTPNLGKKKKPKRLMVPKQNHPNIKIGLSLERSKREVGTLLERYLESN